MKNALMFLEGGAVKVAVGSILKIVPTAELKAPHNVNFFNKLFGEANVMIVESAQPLSREQFDAMANGDTEPEVPPVRPAMTAVARTGPAKRPQTRPPAEPKDFDGNFYRSISPTTITVDDCLTGGEIQPGIPAALVIPAKRVVDLALVPMEARQKSRILERLIANGTLVPSSAAERMALEKKHEAEMMDEESARTEYFSPIVDREEVVSRNNTSRLHTGERGAEPIEVTDDVADTRVTRQAAAIDDIMLNEGAGTMSQLDAVIAQGPPDVEEVVDFDPKAAKRQELAERRRAMNGGAGAAAGVTPVLRKAGGKQ